MVTMTIHRIDLIQTFTTGILKMNIFQPDFQNASSLLPSGDSVIPMDYIIATYFLESKSNLKTAAWELAIGQSVGNPNVRSKWETEDLFRVHSCIVIADEQELTTRKSGTVRIAFPMANINMKEDSISQLLCHLMGGQMDIDNVEQCHLLHIEFPKHVEQQFLGPQFGIAGMRQFTKTFDKPLLGGIVKPKVVNNVDMLLDITKELVDGGVQFIKEDEIMSNPAACPLEKRIPEVMKYIEGKGVVYSFCINGDAPYVMKRVELVHKLGGNGVHLNFWSGLGMYRVIREMDLPLFIHFQKSGDKILTEKSHKYHIDWSVICDLAGLMGVDTIHSGMWGGYMDESETDLKNTLTILRNRNVLPALSCGFHPGLVNIITEKFGIDYLANAGGAIHGHEMGTKAGALAMKQAIDKTGGKEYDAAIRKWGLVK